jgi:hypothetical protein
MGNAKDLDLGQGGHAMAEWKARQSAQIYIWALKESAEAQKLLQALADELNAPTWQPEPPIGTPEREEWQRQQNISASRFASVFAEINRAQDEAAARQKSAKVDDTETPRYYEPTHRQT